MKCFKFKPLDVRRAEKDIQTERTLRNTLRNYQKLVFTAHQAQGRKDTFSRWDHQTKTNLLHQHDRILHPS